MAQALRQKSQDTLHSCKEHLLNLRRVPGTIQLLVTQLRVVESRQSLLPQDTQHLHKHSSTHRPSKSPKCRRDTVAEP